MSWCGIMGGMVVAYRTVPKPDEATHLGQRGRARLLGVLVSVVVAALLSGCAANGTASGGDPGNRKLHMLASDPVFHLLPPDAQADGPLLLTAARYVQPGLDGGGWHGPAVTLRINSVSSPESVFAFYAAHAPATGWTATGSRNVLGFPQVWTKSVPGSKAYLTLTDLDLRTSVAGSPSRYVLNASA